MALKFVSLNHHSANDRVNPQIAWEKVNKYYITKYGDAGFRHTSLATGWYVAYFWKHGNQEFGGNLPGIGPDELAIAKDYLRNGGGHLYYGMNVLNIWPGLPANPTFEDYVKASCNCITDRYHPLTGIPDPDNRQDRCYGIDAVHEYLGNLGEDGKVTAAVNQEALVNWWAYRLCGVERGGYTGDNTFGPKNCFDDPGNPLGLPDWFSSYTDDFDETPFYWLCGLQTFIDFRSPVRDDDEPYGAFSCGWQKMPLVDDTTQKIWAYLTPAESFAFIMDWINGTGNPLHDYRVGAYIMSKECKAHRTDALAPAGSYFVPNWRKYRIDTDKVPYKPTNLIEARLVPDMEGSMSAEYGKWRALFEEFLSDMVDYAGDNQNVIFFNDRESKDMVVQQYDGSVSVDQARVRLIANYLQDKDNWQMEVDEWGDGNEVNRPPNNVKITINDETEYYSLSEAWWYMTAALNDIANGQTTITTRTLEPIVGPYEPANIKYDLENSYLISEWAQHGDFAGKEIDFAYIRKIAPALYANAYTLSLVGPEYTPTAIGSDRRVFLKKVVSFWPLYANDGTKLVANAGEMLYILAKALYNWFTQQTPDPVEFFPTHVLPKYFYKMNQVGVYPITNQPNWFDITQMWTMKPAVLTSEYRD
jgi:hypothetical protein